MRWLIPTVTLSAFLSIPLIVLTGQTQRKPEQKDDVIRISTELVQTDVTVLDKQGHFIEGLRPDQFELLVDGKPQTVSFFEQVIAGTSREAAIVVKAQSGSVPERTVPTAAVADRGRTVFFFVDDLHLTAASLMRTQDALKRFVSENMGTADSVAITTASGQLGFLQQLTNDKQVLELAIKRIKPRYKDVTDMGDPPMTEYHAYAIEQNQGDVREFFIEKTCAAVLKIKPELCSGAGMTNFAVLDEVNTRSDRGSGGGTGSRTSGPVASPNSYRWRAESIVKNRARLITRQAGQVILSTLSSLESLVRRAAALPERKLIVFISDGFFINFVSSTQVYDLRRLTDAATRTGTVIYTVEARGLTSGVTDATRSGIFDNSGRLARINLQEIRAAQQPLYNLAIETGGNTWVDSNNFDAGISKAINETSSYYLLAWRPESNEVVKDRFRRIQVRVKDRPDLTVRVRGGFFAEDPSTLKDADVSGMPVDDQLMEAIRASYPRHGLPVTLSVGYLDKAQDGLTLAASVQIGLPPVDGQQRKGAGDEELDVIGVVSDDNGNIVTSQKQKVTIPADHVASAESVLATFQFSKLEPGLHQVRIAARDSSSRRVGSAWQWLEIPNLRQGNVSLSSIFLTESDPSQTVKIKADSRYRKTAKLRFRTYVYNAAATASAPALVMQLELKREGQTIIQTPALPVKTDGVKDFTRIPLEGEFPLQDLQAGRYELNLVVTDLSTKKNVSQQAKFVVE